MTEEERYEYYQQQERYRWKREEFQRQLEKYFENPRPEVAYLPRRALLRHLENKGLQEEGGVMLEEELTDEIEQRLPLLKDKKYTIEI